MTEPTPYIKRGFVWDVLLKLFLGMFIPVTVAAGGGLLWMARQIERNQTEIRANQQRLEATDRRVYELEQFRLAGPRFTPEMNQTSDLLLKEWTREHFVGAEIIAKMEAQVEAMVTKQELILSDLGQIRERLAAAHINGNGGGNGTTYATPQIFRSP